MTLKALRHYALVSEMIGVEGLVTGELALMIVNLQSLGVSVALTSVPIIASALTSLVLIPLLGFITARLARTPKQKALSLVAVNFLQILGVGIVIVANVLRILDDQNDTEASTTIDNSTFRLTTTALYPPLDLTASPSPSTSTNYSNILDNLRKNVSTSFRSLENITAEGQSSSIKEEEPVLKPYAIIAMVGYIMADSGYDTGSCFLKTFALSSTPRRDHPDVIVRAIQMSSIGGILVTLLGSVGVGEVLAKGTDWNVNSMTTIFILALMVILLIPSATLTLTTGLGCREGLHDRDRSGEDEDEERSKYDGTNDEKQSLISDSWASETSSAAEDKINQWQVSFSSIKNNDEWNNNAASDNTTMRRAAVANSSSRQSSISRDVMEKIFQLSMSGAHSLLEEELNTSIAKSKEAAENGRDFVEIIGGSNSSLGQGCVWRVKRFFRQQEKRLCLCAGSFFALGALFAFNMYTVNFVTVSICDGDANAPPGSAEYENYLRGMKIGSTGLLVFYASFVIGTTTQDFLLRRIGWWREASVMFVVFIVCILVCAIVKVEWFYYVCSCVSGLHRAMIFTVPYILVCRVLTDNGSDADSIHPGDSPTKGDNSGDIALVAAMLPLSMTMCALVIGPMMEYTGDTATPIFFSGVSAFLGLAFFSLLRKY